MKGGRQVKSNGVQLIEELVLIDQGAPGEGNPGTGQDNFLKFIEGLLNVYISDGWETGVTIGAGGKGGATGPRAALGWIWA